MLRFSPVFGLSRSVAHVSFHFLHVIFPRGGLRFGEFIRCMPKSRTVRQPPAGFEPCAGCRQLPAFFQTAPSSFQAHFPLRFSRFQKKTRRPVSWDTEAARVLCVYLSEGKTACSLQKADRKKELGQRQNAGLKTKHPAQRQNAGPKTERQTRRNTGMVSRGAGQTIVVPPS